MTDEQKDALNNDAVKKDLNNMIEVEMGLMPTKDCEQYRMLAIFRDALNLESVPKPQQNPVIQGGVNLTADLNDIKSFSLGQQPNGPDLSINTNPIPAQPIKP